MNTLRVGVAAACLALLAGCADAPTATTLPNRPGPEALPPNAQVAAPVVIPHSEPASSYCPASALAGELRFTPGNPDGAGTIMIRLTKSEERYCQLPGIISTYRNELGMWLHDADGNTLARASDPLAAFETNPPAYQDIPMQPDQPVTIPVAYCGTITPRSAIIKYANAMYGDRRVTPLTIPVTGTSSCTSPPGFTYGPFSTAKQPMVLPATSWTQLHADLNLPESVHGGKFTFRVQVTNNGKTPVRLEPCPTGTLVMGGPSFGAWDSPMQLQCPSDPVIAPHGTAILIGESGTSGFPHGNYVGRFAIAGSNTTEDTTAHRKAG